MDLARALCGYLRMFAVRPVVALPPPGIDSGQRRVSIRVVTKT
jgi:hypothetical protein